MKKKLLCGIVSLLLPLVACSTKPNESSPTASANKSSEKLQPEGVVRDAVRVGAIPDQDPEKLQRLYGKLSTYLQKELGVPVTYKPVTDYTAAVTAFKVGDLDLVWFGGLTGVQAQLQVKGANAIAQRDIDAKFHSTFIANKSTGLKPIQDVSGLKELKGRTFTFGSESSTSGRLMPQYFLKQAGVSLNDFKGQVGFSSSHDATLKLVEAGTYETGVLNEQVWRSRVKSGEANLSKVEVLWRTPSFYDYHWVINPSVNQRYGNDFANKVQAALLKLNPNVPEQKEILDLFGTQKFVATQNSNYNQIETVGREIGKIK